MTKQVALADKTYERLKRNRLPGESFSQEIERLMDDAKKDPWSFVGWSKISKKQADEWIAQIEADRDDATVDA